MGQMLAPLSNPKPQVSQPTEQHISPATTGVREDQNQQAGNHESGVNMCDCGAPAKFFQLQSGKHVCEQCILNEIYTEESYEDVYLKVLNKM